MLQTLVEPTSWDPSSFIIILQYHKSSCWTTDIVQNLRPVHFNLVYRFDMFIFRLGTCVCDCGLRGSVMRLILLKWAKTSLTAFYFYFYFKEWEWLRKHTATSLMWIWMLCKHISSDTATRTNNDIREEQSIQSTHEWRIEDGQAKYGGKAQLNSQAYFYVATVTTLASEAHTRGERARENKKFIRITIIITSRVYKWTKGNVSKLGLSYMHISTHHFFLFFFWRAIDRKALVSPATRSWACCCGCYSFWSFAICFGSFIRNAVCFCNVIVNTTLIGCICLSFCRFIQCMCVCVFMCVIESVVVAFAAAAAAVTVLIRLHFRFKKGGNMFAIIIFRSRIRRVCTTL